MPRFPFKTNTPAHFAAFVAIPRVCRSPGGSNVGFGYLSIELIIYLSIYLFLIGAGSCAARSWPRPRDCAPRCGRSMHAHAPLRIASRCCRLLLRLCACQRVCSGGAAASVAGMPAGIVTEAPLRYRYGGPPPVVRCPPPVSPLDPDLGRACRAGVERTSAPCVYMSLDVTCARSHCLCALCARVPRRDCCSLQRALREAERAG